MMQQAGVLLPVASLPAKHGIGDFGPQAYEFIDILQQMQMQIWQVLPLNPLGYGNSPYQPYSSFAGDEIYLSLELLANDGLLDSPVPLFQDQAQRIDYTAVREFKTSWLRRSFAVFKTQERWHTEFHQFLQQQPWLASYALFITLKQLNNYQPWSLWPAEHKDGGLNHNPQLLTTLAPEIEYQQYLQFIFYRQWLHLKEYANQRGIAIMGDIPIYLGLDSAEVWQQRQYFLLDAAGNPTVVAGVPPDFFSVTGQRWGNPIYNWQAIAADNFQFWLDRLRGNMQAFDIIRIDHFRAFDTYWQIPASCTTAVEGEWVEAPGYELFARIYQELPQIKIVVEDLGDLRPQVLQLRDHFNLTGMQIFQCLFNPRANNQQLTQSQNTIIYTGTHDNNTLAGWYATLSKRQRQRLHKFFASKDDLRHAIIKYLLNCAAKYVIFPVQDLIGLDDRARINRPATVGSPNWEWKLANFTALQDEITFMAEQIHASGRGAHYEEEQHDALQA